MKKIVIGVLATFLSLTFIPAQLSASALEEPSSVVDPKPAESAEAKALEVRLSELNAKDKSDLTAAEKKSMRKEVKSINHKLREIGGGVYLSVGAVILICILLIVLL